MTTQALTTKRLHVVAAALIDSSGKVLIQRRASEAHQGGLWEFPGGKVEAGESREQALRRELSEELGIHALSMRPLINVPHDYSDRQVLLDVWRIERWRGEVCAMEGQPLAWVAKENFSDYHFPAADRPVLRALQLPDRVLVTPDVNAGEQAWLSQLQSALCKGVSLLQVRLNGASREQVVELSTQVMNLVKSGAVQAQVVVNAGPDILADVDAHGVHLNSKRLWQFSQRPIATDKLLGVSCHSEADLRQAHLIGADFALLGPVAKTATHPDARPLGWPCFEQWVAEAKLPVYALGGMHSEDLAKAQMLGGQGIAAIRGLWD